MNILGVVLRGSRQVVPGAIAQQLRFAGAKTPMPGRKRDRSASSEKAAKAKVKEPKVVIGGAAKVNHNEDLCKVLMEMATIEKNNGVMHKWKVYRQAVDSLKTLDHRVTSGKEAVKLPGIGPKIAARIEEVLTTGKLGQLEGYKEDPVVTATALFNSVSGFGPKAAQAFVAKGYRTLDDVLKADEPLTAHQQIGIKYHKDLLKKIPFDEVKAIADKAKAVAQKVDKALIVTPCGSHRRKLPQSGDIDCLMTHPLSNSDSGEAYLYLKKVSEKLRESKLIIDVISEGSTKLMAVCRLPSKPARRIDIRWVPYDSYPSALLYFTGSSIFNTSMRAQAIKLNYTLNEYGLYECDASGGKGKRVPTASEEDIFKILNIAYCPPEDRCM